MRGIYPGILFSCKLPLVCFIWISFGSTSARGDLSTTDPYFDDQSSRLIDAIEGQTIVIPCVVKNLKGERVVSWIRTQDIQILTSGSHTFASDYRFEVVHSNANVDFWGLRIRGVKEYDAGQYECQVNTEPKMSLAYQLIVSAMGMEDNSKWLGTAKIMEPNEIFVQHGSALVVNCVITRSVPKTVSLDVWWLQEDTQIIESVDSRRTIKSSYDKSKNQLHSVLSFSYITWQDTGTYTCLQPSVKKDNLKIVVVEAAEPSEAMQRDFPQSSNSDRSFIVLPTILLSLLCITFCCNLNL